MESGLELVDHGKVCGPRYDISTEGLPPDWVQAYMTETEGTWGTVVTGLDGHRMTMPFLWGMFLSDAAIAGDWAILQMWNPKNLDSVFSGKRPVHKG